jgi:hypothetical protein
MLSHLLVILVSRIDSVAGEKVTLPVPDLVPQTEDHR